MSAVPAGRKRVLARLFAVVVTVIATVGGGAASARTPEHTVLQILGSWTVSYPDRHVTVRGRLFTAGHGVASARVGLVAFATGGSSRTDLGTVTTDADGVFRTEATVPGPDGIRASYAGDAAYQAAGDTQYIDATEHLPTRITVDRSVRPGRATSNASPAASKCRNLAERGSPHPARS